MIKAERYLAKARPLEDTTPSFPVVIEAMHLVGPPSDTMAVCEWVRNSGFPWLIGNALQPSTLIPESGGKEGDPGLYIDPATGQLVIHTSEGNARAGYGDWIIKVAYGNVLTCKPDEFDSMYEKE